MSDNKSMNDIVEIPSPRGVLRLRPEREDDQAFRYRLFWDSRPELALLPLEPAMREQLMQHQFRAQTVSYRAQFPDARFDIIELDGAAIGRIVVDRPGSAIHIIDQAIMPQRRNLGLGSTIMRALMQEAARAGLPVRLMVSTANDPSQRLYLRLGFVPIQTGVTHIELEWRPGSAATSGASAP
jgi:ribosomal protein S18 acetylase RimI-like enzyme